MTEDKRGVSPLHTTRRLSVSASMPMPISSPSVVTTSSSSSSSSALLQLLSPDGYYTYLQIPKGIEPMNLQNSTNIPDQDLIIKNYRRLSLRHHPDRKGGDTETFRVLNRAKRVLTHAKLRQQYDLLGFDLEDEDEKDDAVVDEEEEEDDDDDEKVEEEEKEEEHNDRKVKEASSKADTTSNKNKPKKKKAKERNSTSDTVLNQLASVTLAFLLQLLIRTAILGLVSTFVSRFLWTMIPFELLLLITALRIWLDTKRIDTTASSKNMKWIEIMSPLLIAGGVVCMFYGKAIWGFQFWFGETLVMTLFLYNSIFNSGTNSVSSPSMAIRILFFLFLGCSCATLVLRGKWGRYGIVLLLQLFLALVALIAFPMMEMLLEQIIHEKLRKIGDKLRTQTKRLDELKRMENPSRTHEPM